MQVAAQPSTLLCHGLQGSSARRLQLGVATQRVDQAEVSLASWSSSARSTRPYGSPGVRVADAHLAHPLAPIHQRQYQRRVLLRAGDRHGFDLRSAM